MNQPNPAVQYAHLTLADIKNHIATATMPPATAFAILEARIAKRIAAGKPLIPQVVEFRNELPKTTVGKILRRELREARR